MKYIIFLVDADRLFDTALGMYDFSLVLMIAQHAQKVRWLFLAFIHVLIHILFYAPVVVDVHDATVELLISICWLLMQDPREYLPFLRELRSLDKYYQRFRIDDHLRRYQKALRNLSLAGESCVFFCAYSPWSMRFVICTGGALDVKIS